MSVIMCRDKVYPSDIRVEAIDEIGNGSCEVALFSGPFAYERATTFADCWYANYTDEILSPALPTKADP